MKIEISNSLATVLIANYNNSMVVSEPKIRSLEGSEPLKKETNNTYNITI